jgi:uncharacterized protein with HEPN domain
MSERKDVDLIQDIVESMSRIIFYMRNMEYDEFKKDKKTQDAVIRNIEIMGEATKALSEKVRKANANIPWKNIAGTRDKLIHNYFGVNIDIIWNIVQDEIPSLLPEIERIHQDLKESNG